MKNWMKNQLRADYESYVADVLALLICLALVFIVLVIYNVARGEPELTKPPVCRTEFGHRVECRTMGHSKFYFIGHVFN
jgi:hypothetical protein